jgi:hypothetical protein
VSFRFLYSKMLRLPANRQGPNLPKPGKVFCFLNFSLKRKSTPDRDRHPEKEGEEEDRVQNLILYIFVCTQEVNRTCKYYSPWLSGASTVGALGCLRRRVCAGSRGSVLAVWLIGRPSHSSGLLSETCLKTPSLQNCMKISKNLYVSAFTKNRNDFHIYFHATKNKNNR